ncbi:hypothetical protein F5Y18DRAFT_418892 [Xylariaceae sp. FL1019]|nr:hypothetical protein F5Y18DRAFT_418892 [Xylariaceae sp. FL1019]
MSEHHLSTPLGTPLGARGTLRPRPSPLRAKSPSPARQRLDPDDLLSHLTPASVVDVLQTPTGSLKKCMDRASTTEHSFAMKAAIASKSINGWLGELSAWPWPKTGTSAGFEMPPTKKRKLFEPETPEVGQESTPHSGPTYFGSLPVDDVIRYETRLDQIKGDMEGLDLEDIKNQILRNHILPLSRPGTPFSDAGRSVASAYTFNRLEDLTAVVTAITIQTLPALSKLSRLLNTWNVRLIVLRKTPALLVMIKDAEIAIEAGQKAIEPPIPSSSESVGAGKSGQKPVERLSKKDFDVMKSVLEQKVSKPGQALDNMLDLLEGMPDTLPEEWLDRMETIERDYVEWLITAERKIPSSQPSKARPAVSFSQGHPTRPAKEPRSKTYDGSKDVADQSKPSNPILSEVNRNIVRPHLNEPSRREELVLKPASDDDEFEPSILESVNEEDEDLELPSPPRIRQGSHPSVTSTVLYGSSSYSPDRSDDGRYRDASLEPDLPRLPDHNEPFSSDAISPPSSPPLRFKPRSTSVTFKEVPEIALLPEADRSPPRTPREPLEVFDPDTSFEWESQLGSPSRMSTLSTMSDDDHLQRQIREVLETIPAKIELKKRAINLNPPDLQLPSRPKARHSDPRRPTSALSSRSSRAGTPSYSRSGTPAFMLAPVRESRPRSMSSQGIRAFHLSRSGEAPVKLFIRCVGEGNERVMVRVGGGWSDLGEYLRDYAFHHGSRSKGEGKVEVTDAVAAAAGRIGSSPASRPGSALDSPISPLTVRKTRKSLSEEGASYFPKTPLLRTNLEDSADTPGSQASALSRGSTHTVDWDEEDSSLGLAGPKANKRREISDESKAWVESMKEKVRLVSGERVHSQISTEQLRPLSQSPQRGPLKKKPDTEAFGNMGKVGSTKRLFKKN